MIKKKIVLSICSLDSVTFNVRNRLVSGLPCLSSIQVNWSEGVFPENISSGQAWCLMTEFLISVVCGALQWEISTRFLGCDDC